MKTTLSLALACVTLIFFRSGAQAAEKKDAKTQLQELVAAVKAKLQQNKTSESDLAPELKKFDEALAEHKGEKTDEVAEILFMKAALYLEVIKNSDKGQALLKDLKETFPDTTPGKRVDEVLAAVQQKAAGEKIRQSLVVGAKFPDFAEKDLKGNPLSIANHKGKVVLIDFWATWCGPCVRELPNVLEAYRKYHDQGFEIIGISLDKDQETLKNFLENKDITWPQYFDGKGWQNKLAAQYAVQGIPATYLLDGEGKIVATDIRGETLLREVGRLVSKKSSASGDQ